MDASNQQESQENKMETGNFRNSEELIMLVDEKTNEPVGECLRKKMRKENLCHRASYVFVENCEGRFVVQVRSMSKEYCPGGYALATGGVQGAQESNELNAMRELEEELGVSRDIAEFKLVE